LTRAARSEDFGRAAVSSRVRVLVVLWLVLLVGGVYANTLRNGFAVDDVPIVQENTRVHGLADLRSVLLGSYWPDSGEHYRPVVLLSFAVDWAISGGHPAWFHGVNIALHAAVTALVYLLLLRLGAAAVAAALGAAVFAVHPVHVEAVANIVGRAEMLATLFFLLACLLHLRRGTPAAIRIAGVAGCYLLALGAKENAVMLPAILLLLTLYSQRQESGRWPGFWRSVRQDGVLNLVLGGVLAGYLALRSAVLGWEKGSGTASYLADLTTAERLATAVRLWPEYLRLLFWPRDLSWDWGPPLVEPAGWSHPMVWLGLALGAAIAGLVIVSWRDSGWAALAVLWFAVTIFPVSQIPFPVGVLLAERLLYLPSVALVLLVPPLVAALLQTRREVRTALAAASLMLLCLGAWRTWTRTPVWESTHAASANLAAEHPESYRVAWTVAGLLAAYGRTEEALRMYWRADSLTRGSYYNISLDRAAALLAAGRPGEAEPVVRKAITQTPMIARGYHVFASSLIDQARFREAADATATGRAVARFGPGTAREFAHRAALAYDGLGMLDSARVESVNSVLAPGSGAKSAQWLHLARIHRLLGEAELADAALAEARTVATPEIRGHITAEPYLDLCSPLIRSWSVPPAMQPTN
jgi:hypothetical protein